MDWAVVLSIGILFYMHYLSCRDAHVSNPKLPDPEPENVVMRHLSPPWDEIFAAHLSRTQLDDSKKLGMMGLANQLFKIYFQINKLNLCKSMIRAIDNLNIFDRFSLAQRVTYSYYVGRKSTFEGAFTEANKWLSFAFEHCLSSAWHNKRLILIYLIPVKMLLGIFPSPSLLTKYNLREFDGISEAAKSEMMKTHLLPLDVFTAALRIMGVDDVDQDETECILANLIYEGKIKGYLAHQQQKLVVSKMQAFPSLASLSASR